MFDFCVYLFMHSFNTCIRVHGFHQVFWYLEPFSVNMLRLSVLMELYFPLIFFPPVASWLSPGRSTRSISMQYVSLINALKFIHLVE